MWLLLKSKIRWFTLEKKKTTRTQQKKQLFMHVCRAPVSTLKAAFMFPPPALGAIPSVRACVSPPLCVFSSSSLSCTTCSHSPSSSKHWLRLRVIGRRTFSSDSLCSLSCSTCRGRCRGQMWRECKKRGEERLESEGRFGDEVKRGEGAGGR